MLPKSKQLEVKTSILPNAGMGLFAKMVFKKGDTIIEYVGEMTTWEKVKDDAENNYIFHIDDEHVIDAKNDLKSFGRYVNDAAGLTRVKGVKNNAMYEEKGYQVFIIADKDILPGEEILVAYGKEYWQQIKENIKVDADVS